MKTSLWQELTRRGRRSLFLSAKRLRWKLAPVPAERRRRVLVAGVQRSGTNMLMDILEKHWQVDAYHERDPRAFDNYAMRALPVIDRLMARSGHPVFAIKSLFELQILPQLMEHMAPARILWIVRDHHDTVNSTLKSFSRNLVPRINRALKPDTGEWLGGGMSAATRERLAPLVHPEMAPADAAAIQWYFRNVLFFEHGFDHNAAVLPISYERLVTKPEKEIQRMCHFLELPYQPRMSRGIYASSIGKRRKPELSPEVESLCDELAGRFAPLVTA